MKSFMVLLALILAAGGCTTRAPDRPGTSESVETVPESPPPAPSRTPVGDLGDVVVVERGTVTVRLGAAEFRAGSVLRVIVANGLDRTIYSDDFKTDCSIVTLERRTASGWDPIVGCALGRPTMTVAIGPSRGRTIEIDPRSMHLQKAAAGGPLAFSGGTYRVAFTYRTQPQPGPQERTVYSAVFQIR